VRLKAERICPEPSQIIFQGLGLKQSAGREADWVPDKFSFVALRRKENFLE
jgi:hypothetical protein